MSIDDLIARLEAATEGSRDLDAAIYRPPGTGETPLRNRTL